MIIRIHTHALIKYTPVSRYMCFIQYCYNVLRTIYLSNDFFILF